MIRNWPVHRLVPDEEEQALVRVPEGDEEAQRLALALAQIASADFIESIIHLKSGLDRFGGQGFVIANRHKFDGNGDPTQGAGSYETTGYAFSYAHKQTAVKGVPVEPDDELPMTPPKAPEQNGTSEPAPVET